MTVFAGVFAVVFLGSFDGALDFFAAFMCPSRIEEVRWRLGDGKIFAGDENRPIDIPVSYCPQCGRPKPLVAYCNIGWINVATEEPPTLYYGRDAGTPYSRETVHNESVKRAECSYKSLDQSYRELTWMFGLFDVICLYVGNIPDIRGIFSPRIAAPLSLFPPFVVPLSRIFLPYSYGI